MLEVSGLEYEGASRQADPAAPAAVYATEPMPDDTGQYGVYTDHARTGGAYHQDQHGEQQPQYAAYDPYDGYGGQAPQDPYGGQGGYQDQGAYQGQGGYQDQGGHAAGQYDHGADRTDHGAYSDPYNGAGTTTGTGQYTPYDSYGNGYDPASYATGQQQPEDPYAGQYTDTPPGGVWVPQQRESDQYPRCRRRSPSSPPRTATATTRARTSSTATDPPRLPAPRPRVHRTPPTLPKAHCEPRKPSPSTTSPATRAPDIPA